MTKKYFWVSLAILFAVPSLAQKPITVKEAIKKNSFRPDYIYGIRSMKNGKYYTVLDRKGPESRVVKYAYKTGKEVASLFRQKEHPQLPIIQNYSFSKDESKLLIHTQLESIYRHSERGIFYIYDLKTKKLTKVSKNKIQEPKFSNQGDKIAFVHENNIFYLDLKNKNRLVQITKDGEKNKIINGLADWVYEEEFSFVRAFEWSPNGEYLAFLRFDEREVPTFSMDVFGSTLYPNQYEFKYPKAGEKNSKISLHIYNLKSKKTTQVKANKTKREIYIPRIKWNLSDELTFMVMNRHQNKLLLNIYDPQKNKVKVLLTENSETYIDVHDNLRFLKDGSFIWTSEKSGFNHIYHYEKDGNLIQQLTKGNWEVTDFYGISADQKRVYFQSTQDGSINRTISVAEILTGSVKRLTQKQGTNNASFSTSCDYYINNYSDTSTPYEFKLIETKSNKVVRVLTDNADLKAKMKEYYFPKKEFTEIALDNGVKLNSWMIKPSNFDPNKKYPVLMFVYGGPGSQTVKNEWDSRNYMWFSALVEQGYIVISVDNRGTGGKGAKFKKATYQQLGKYEIEDQIDAAKLIGKRTYVDEKRMGMFGWSFGGFMTLLAMSKGADVFKTGISVAPVTSWRFYDTIYTERYMRTPAENELGYDQNSPINHISKIKNNFLLVHGTGDDNVHYQNSMRVIETLIQQDKQFEQFIYPDKNHGIYGGNTRNHLYTMMTNFILKNL